MLSIGWSEKGAAGCVAGSEDQPLKSFELSGTRVSTPKFLPRSDLHRCLNPRARQKIQRFSNHLPLHRLQVGAADVPKLSGRLVSNVVCYVAGIPDHHVVVVDRFTINEAVEVCFGQAAESAGAVDSVVKLRSVITKNPNVAARI